MPPASRTLKAPASTTITTSSHAVASGESREDAAALSIAFARFLRWLVQVQNCVDAACDDAYKLDRLLLQGVLPLRPRTVPVPVVSVGLKAAVYELVVGAAEREQAEAQRARHLHRTWKLTGAPQEQTRGQKAATYSHFPPATAAAGASDASSPALTHSSTPACPYRDFCAQQQQQQPVAGGAKRGSRSSNRHSSSSSSSSSDEESNGAHAEDAKRVGVLFSAAFRKRESEEGGTTAANRRPQHEASSFAARLKDTVRSGSGAAAAAASSPATATPTAPVPSSTTTRTPLSGHEAASHPRRESAALSQREGPGSASMQSLPPARQLFLPVSAADVPVRVSSAAGSSDEVEGETEEKHAGQRAAQVAEAVPIPVGPETLPSRSLHPIWSHIAAEELRRCPLCSGQLLVQSTWHALYLLQLLTMMSASSAMAAPLPLPPPPVLQIQPVEALLLLFQTAQRCFVAGLATASAVSLPQRPRWAEKARVGGGSSSSSNQRGAKAHASAQSKGASSITVAAGGTPPPLLSLSLPTLPSSSAATGYGVALSTEEAQLQSREDALMSALAHRTLGVVDALSGSAVAELWPPEALVAPTATGTEPSTPAQAVSLVDLHGAVLALRCRIFSGAFAVLMTEDGVTRGLTALEAAAEALVRLVSVLYAVPDSTVPRSTTEGKRTTSASASPGEATHRVYLALTEALSTCAKGSPVESGADDTTKDQLAVVHDDVRALCCVVALLAVFTELVDAQEFDSVDSATPAFALSGVAAKLVDTVVLPTLLELQNSSRGSCSAQARLLLALWWLLRAETIRQWVHTSRPINNTAPAANLRVLDSELTLLEAETRSGEAVHWSAWLKDAARAAVRASNAASEFLGLSFHPTTLTSPSPLLAPASDATLRWWLPADTGASTLRIASLPLPWVRMWLLLCPPLFQVSPTDVLGLRHTVQQHVANNGAGPTAAEDASEAAAAAGASADRTASHVAQQQRTEVTAKSVSKPAKMKTGRPAHPPLNVSDRLQRTTRSQSRVNDGDDDRPPRDVNLLQQHLRCSTAPVYFWTRWSRLFCLDGRRQQRAENDDGAVPFTAQAVSAAVELLRNPTRAFPLADAQLSVEGASVSSALPTTPLAMSLQAAFPALPPSALAEALAAEAQSFWPRENSAAATADAHLLFAPYSFAARVPVLRSAVLAFHHTLTTSAQQPEPRSSQTFSPSPPRANDDAADEAGQPPSKPRSTAVKRSPLVAARKLPRRIGDKGGRSSSSTAPSPSPPPPHTRSTTPEPAALP